MSHTRCFAAIRKLASESSSSCRHDNMNRIGCPSRIRLLPLEARSHSSLGTFHLSLAAHHILLITHHSVSIPHHFSLITDPPPLALHSKYRILWTVPSTASAPTYPSGVSRSYRENAETPPGSSSVDRIAG